MTEDKKESIARKIQALIAKTGEGSNCSEAEALAATKLIDKLLFKYNLDISEVSYKNSEFEKLTIDTGKKKKGFSQFLCISIANLTDCKAWASKKKSENQTYIFFGEKTNTQAANFLYDLLTNAISYEAKKYQKSTEYKEQKKYISGATLSNSFRLGCASRIGKRLDEMKAENNRDTQNEGLVLFDRMEIVNQKFKELNLNLNKARNNKAHYNSGAFDSGDKAASNINIRQGVKESTSGKRALQA
jgi:hypothetical protein